MALQVRLGGVADPTSQVMLNIWPDAAGDYLVDVGGQQRTVTIADASDYQGCTWQLFTGLSGNVPWSVSGPGGSRSGVARLVPASGAHRTVYGSCFQQYFWFEQSLPHMVLDEPHQFVSLGDFPYNDNSRQMSYNPTRANLRFQFWRNTNREFVQSLMHSAAWSAVTSDHDAYLGNDLPGLDSITGGNAFPGDAAANFYINLNPPGSGPTKVIANLTDGTGPANSTFTNWSNPNSPTQAVRDLMLEGEIEFDAHHRIAPNPDVGQTFGGGPVPANAPYTRWTVGRVEYFLIEQFRWQDYRSNSGSVNNRTMLGAVQLAWLLARIAASTAPFKVILAAQMLLKENTPSNLGRNDYGHSSFFDEGETLKNALTDFTGWAKPGGVVVVSGDVHTPQVHYMDRGAGLLQITPCPSGIDFVPEPSGIGDSADTKLLWWEKYPTGVATIPFVRYYGLIEDPATGPLICQLKDSDGRVRYEALINEGSNAPSYRRRRISA